MSKKKDKEEKKVEEPQEELSGNGVFIYPNQSRYEGSWIKDAGVKKRNGKGTFQEGEYSYTGDFKLDAMHGQGIFKFANGASYEGEWVENKMEGKGKYRWPDSSSYEGDWKANQMHGEGLFTDRDGQQWRGNFYNGVSACPLNMYKAD